MLSTVILAYSSLLLFNPSSSFIAYDCQSQTMNITSFSLVEIGKCKLPASRVSIVKEKIQIKELETLLVYQCKLHVTRMVTHCGMHSHSSMVSDGLSTYIYPISREMCLEAHRLRALRYFYGQHIEDLVINGTTSASIRLGGKLDKEGNCKGISYEDNKGKWDDVIVQAAVEITLYQKYVPANIDENQIVLPGGIMCPYKEKTCVDTIFGHTFWDHVDNDKCSTTKYLVLYEGDADRISPINVTNRNYHTTIYTVNQGNTIFAMPISNPTIICGQVAYETDHPKFFIIKESEIGSFYFKKSEINVFNMDPTAYVNAKVFFIERHIQQQVTSLYHNVINQKCELEQQVLRNLQTLAITNPAEFAYAKTKVPGYTAVSYGEIVHIIQCSPVEVKLRSTERCFQELPVTYDNQSLFLAPRSHVIQKYANEISCSPFLFSAYKLNNRWYRTDRTAREIPSPQILEPEENLEWSYVNPTNLFTGGLYSQEEMDQLQRHLILPVERQAVEGIVARGVMGMSPDMQGTSFEKMIGEDTIKGWAKKLWSSLFYWLTTLGSITSGVMGIYIVFRGIKFLADTVIHGVLLYDLFGWSFRIIGALLDSVTMYCVHIHGKTGADQTTNHSKEPDLEGNPPLMDFPGGSSQTLTNHPYPKLEGQPIASMTSQGPQPSSDRRWAIP